MKTAIKKSLIICVILTLTVSAMLLCACNNGDDFRNARNGEPESGEFYSLQSAFDNGWISRGDLRNMAYYHMGDAQKKGFKPTPKNPEMLSASTELVIKQAYLEKYCTDVSNPTIEGVTISAYYGEYEGFIALMIDCIYYGSFMVITEKLIGGVKFVYKDSNTMWLWKE